MGDVELNLIAIVLVLAPAVNWYVFGRVVEAAWPKPRIEYLNADVLISLGIAVSSSLAALIGVHVLRFTATGERILPPGAVAVVLAAALIVISLPNLNKLRVLAQLRRKARRGAHDRRGDLPGGS